MQTWDNYIICTPPLQILADGVSLSAYWCLSQASEVQMTVSFLEADILHLMCGVNNDQPAHKHISVLVITCLFFLQ